MESGAPAQQRLRHRALPDFALWQYAPTRDEHLGDAGLSQPAGREIFRRGRPPNFHQRARHHEARTEAKVLGGGSCRGPGSAANDVV